MMHIELTIDVTHIVHGGGMCQHNAMMSNNDMPLCQMAHDYLCQLVNDGTIDNVGCAKCTITWLCGDCEHMTTNDDCEHNTMGVTNEQSM